MSLDPLLPVPLIAVMAAVALASAVARLRRGAPKVAIARALAMLVLAAAVAVDPTLAGGSGEARRSAADVLFVVDSTSSMAALDFDGGAPRLDGVRADIVELAAAFPGGHFSLIRFDSRARLELPWTTDRGALATAVSVLRQERAVYSRGSQLDLPLALIDEQLPRPSGVRDGRTSHTLVFFFSDGEERAGAGSDPPAGASETGVALPDEESGEQAITSFVELAADVDGGAVFGYGTTHGAPLLEFVGSDELFTAGDSPYVYDYATAGPAISRLDEDNLVEIASELGLPYVHRSEPGGLGGMASELADAAPMVSDGVRDAPRRLYWIPSLGLLVLLMWQAVTAITEATATRQLFRGSTTPKATEPSTVVAESAPRHRREEPAA
jgi:Ca-activated chloride channel homolog